jgi:ABC-2 type transport system ATP-binding protein
MLAAEDLSKRYLPPLSLLRPLIRVASPEPVDALRDISLTVEPGEIVGLVGPNGAGKTTLIKILATVLAPTTGRASIAGHDVVTSSDGARRNLGLVLAEERSAYWRLTGRQNLEFFGVLAGLSRNDARRRAGELLELLDLAGRDKMVFGYSAGMRSRLSLARALLARPPVLVLDEPTRSLDPLAMDAVHRLLQEAADDGHAILLSSHQLDEVVSICHRVAILIEGEMRFAGTSEQLDTDGRGAVSALGTFLAREAERP